eukprot:scaffold2633_cov156-Amphora_coffeaeformis.AAC.20
MNASKRIICRDRVIRHRCVVLTLVAALFFAKLTEASSDTGVFQNLSPSLAASMSQGTTIAVPCRVYGNDNSAAAADREPFDGVLILTRTPKQRMNFPDDKSHDCDRTERRGDLNVWPYDTLSFSDPLLPKRWNVIGENSVVCMTGFSPEVHFLTRLLQEIVDSSRQTLESDGFERTPPAVELMKNLAQHYQINALSKSSRPFGVAILMVGRSSDRSRWQVWTLDPSGSLRSGKIGAIGKEAPTFIKKLTEKQRVGGTPHETLTRMLRVSRETLQDASKGTDIKEYEAILLCWGGDSMQVGRVSSEDIQECLTKIIDEENQREREEA